MREEYASWKEVVINFFEHKVGTSKLFKERERLDKKKNDLEKELDTKKIEKIKSNIKKNEETLKNLRKNAPRTEVRDWIDIVTKKNISVGKRIIKATHALKFTHSSAPNSGVLVNDIENDILLTTATLSKNRAYDLAYNNGNLITVSRFLSLDLNGKWIFDCILENKFDFLEGFYESEEQLKDWKKGLSSLIEERTIRNAEFTKQIYFPINEKEAKYQILAPLFSTSIAENIFFKITDIIFDSVQVEIRKKRAKKETVKYCKDILIEYPNKSVVKFGGSQPQNVSMLNKGRKWKADLKDKTTYGICYLFNSSPPTWHSKLKPPIYKRSLFNESSIAWQARENIDYLRDFLMRFEKIELSIKAPKRKKWVDSWVNNIIDEVFFYISSIQTLPSGWSDSSDIKLKLEHQYLLDPYRNNKEFQAARKNVDWQSVICKDFSNWLNYKLSGKTKQFTPQNTNTRIWYNLFEQALREFNSNTDSGIAKQTEEEV